MSSRPLVGCSIGLAHKKVPIVGVIIMPFLNQLVGSAISVGRTILTTSVSGQFSARVGGGAYLNETIRLPLHDKPQSLQSLQECLIGFECKGFLTQPRCMELILLT